MNRYLLVILILTYSFYSPAQNPSKFGVSESDLPTGIDVGDTVENVDLHILGQKEVNLYDYSSERPTVILFYRGEWCPVCNKYLSNLSDSLELIQQKANVLVVSPETEENVFKMREEHPEYVYVIDDEEFIMEAFDVLFEVTEKYQKKIKAFLRTDIAQHNGQDKARLPVPATYIINKNGEVIFKHFEYDYSVRATAKSILNALN